MEDLQKRIKNLRESKGWDTDAELLLIAIQEEAGEIAGSYLAQHPKYRKLGAQRETLSNEIGDLLVGIIAFCNKMDIDVQESVEYSLKKIERKG